MGSTASFAPFARFLIFCLLMASTPAVISAAEADSVGLSGDTAMGRDRVTEVTPAQFNRLPVRTIEDWLALQKGVVVPYTGSRELHIRGGRDYHNAFLLNGVRIENPFTGRLVSTVSPYALGEMRLSRNGGNAPRGGYLGGLIDITSPTGGEKLAGSAAVVSDNVGSGFDRNWYDLTLSGPLGAAKNVRFFVAAERRYLYDHLPSNRASDVLPGGEKSLPGNVQQGWSYHGKVDWYVNEGTSLTGWADYSLDDIQTYRHEFYYFPDHNPRTEDKTLSLGTSFNHKFTPKTDLRTAVYYFRAESVHGDGVVVDDFLAYERSVANPGYDQFGLFRDSSAAGMIPYYDYFVKNKAQYLGFDGALTVAASQTSTVTAGLDLRTYTLRAFESLTPSQGFSSGTVNRYGYDEAADESGDDSKFDGPKNPRIGGVYIQDRIALKNLTIIAAARVDYFDLNDRKLKDSAAPLGPDNTTLDEADLVDTDTYIRFSPRLTVSAPMSDNATVFGSFAIMHQLPPFAYTYTGWEFFTRRLIAGSFYYFANPSLKPARNMLAEAGISGRLNENVRGSITGFFADRAAGIQVVHQAAIPRSYDLYATELDGSSYGVEVTVQLSPAKSVSLDIAYTLSSTKSNEFSNFNVAWKNPYGSSEQWPERYDQTHKFAGVFDFHAGPGEGPRVGGTALFQDLSAVVVAYAASGFRYTKTNPFDPFGSSVQMEPIEAQNTSRTPAMFQIDLKIQRTIRFGRINIVPFLWIQNLLDRENVVTVYNGTGEPDNTGYLGTPEGESRAADPITGDDFLRAYNLRQNDPGNFGMPRQIYFGLRAEF